MKRTLRLLGMSGIAIGAIWLLRARRRDGMRGFVTHRFNPVVMKAGLAGGRVSPWAILEHVGRTSGTTYRTPIYARIGGDHAFVRMPYGSDVHWVRNIQAAGHCRIQLHETIVELDEPSIVPASDNPMVPPSMRKALDRAGRLYLRLHVLDRVPGTFARRLPEPAVEATTVHAPALEMVRPGDEIPREPITA